MGSVTHSNAEAHCCVSNHLRTKTELGGRGEWDVVSQCVWCGSRFIVVPWSFVAFSENNSDNVWLCNIPDLMRNELCCHFPGYSAMSVIAPSGSWWKSTSDPSSTGDAQRRIIKRGTCTTRYSVSQRLYHMYVLITHLRSLFFLHLFSVCLQCNHILNHITFKCAVCRI